MRADDRNPLFATGTPRPPAGAPSRGGPRSSAHSRSGFQLDPKEGSGVDAHQTEIQVRRGRDSNPRGFRLPLFESGTINHSDTSPHRSLNFRVPLKRFNYHVKWPFFAFVCSSRSCTPRLNRQSPTDHEISAATIYGWERSLRAGSFSRTWWTTFAALKTPAATS